MGQILHGSTKTTEAIRRAIQNSKESIAKLAKTYSINLKTVQKWKKRNYVHDTAMGPNKICFTLLTTDEEALIVAFLLSFWLIRRNNNFCSVFILTLMRKERY